MHDSHILFYSVTMERKIYTFEGSMLIPVVLLMHTRVIHEYKSLMISEKIYKYSEMYIFYRKKKIKFDQVFI